jgi:hypothetical protein
VIGVASRFWTLQAKTASLAAVGHYPHPVSTWPKSLSVIEELFDGVPERERDLMVEHNAARIWNL